MVSKHATSFCKWIIVTLILKLSLTLQTWPSLHVDRKCSWLGPSGGGSGYIVHVRGGDCFVPFHSSYWGKHLARLFVMPYFVVRLLSANTSFKRLPSWFRTVKCLFPENIHIPRRHFCFNDSTRCTCHGPSPLEFLWFSHLVGYPLERIFLSKKLMHALYFCAISFLSYIAAFWTPLPSEFPLSFVGVYVYFLELQNLGDCK